MAMYVMSATQSWFGPSTILSRARSGKMGPSWSLSVVATNRLRRLGCRSCSRMRRRRIDENAAMAQLGANPAIAVGLELIADRDHVRDDLGVISLQRRRVVKGGARQAHQAASFGNGEAMGPAVMDVVALLGRGVLLEAPLKNSISSACRPTMRSRAAIFASYSCKRSAARMSSSKAPASYFATQMRIRLRDRSWRFASACRVSPAMYSWAT